MKFSAARPAAVSSVELQYSCSRPCSLCFRNHSEMLTMVCSRARLRVRLSWSSQILLLHVLDLRTPLPRQGDVTDSFIPSVPYIHSALVVNCSGLMYYQLQLGWVVLFILFRFGGSAFCVSLVFVRSRRENLLLLSWQSLRHVHSLSTLVPEVFLDFSSRKRSRASREAATTSRKSDEEREKNLWFPWPRMSLSCRRQLSNASNW